MSDDDIINENMALWVRNANQAATIARLRDESDGQFRRIAELEAELADALPAVRAEQRKTARAEDRLAAVIAKFDGHHMYRGQCIGCVRRFGGAHYDECDLADIRAAATGDPS